MSLYNKKWDGICPVSECNCFHQDENDWLSTRDVKEAIKELKARLLSDKMFSQCDKDLIELEINEIFGKELSSEEESE